MTLITPLNDPNHELKERYNSFSPVLFAEIVQSWQIQAQLTI
jgi:hypothetical protein